MKNKKEQAKESEVQRAEIIANSNNGMTMRTRTIQNKKAYNRAKIKNTIVEQLTENKNSKVLYLQK